MSKNGKKEISNMQKSNSKKKGAVSESSAPKRRVRSDGVRKMRIKIAIIVASAIGFIGIIILLIIAANSAFNETSETSDSSDTKEERTIIKKVEKSVSGESAERDQKDALNKMTELFIAMSESPTGASDDERLKALENGDISVISDDAKKMFYIPEVADEEYRTAAYQSIITLQILMKEGGLDELVPDKEAWRIVNINPEVGIAYVPLDAFTSGGAMFIFEMVYVDDEWKFSPYTFINSILIADAVQQQTLQEAGRQTLSIPDEP